MGLAAFCGITLPDGLRKNEKLPEPLITPSTKESGAMAHDRSVPPEEISANRADWIRDWNELVTR